MLSSFLPATNNVANAPDELKKRISAVNSRRHKVRFMTVETFLNTSTRGWIIKTGALHSFLPLFTRYGCRNCAKWITVTSVAPCNAQTRISTMLLPRPESLPLEARHKLSRTTLSCITMSAGRKDARVRCSLGGKRG